MKSGHTKLENIVATTTINIVVITIIVKCKTLFYHKFGDKMITYDPFWKTLKASSESTYSLINHHNISSSTLDRLRKNKGITTQTIDDLCRILKCRVEDIMIYTEEKD